MLLAPPAKTPPPPQTPQVCATPCLSRTLDCSPVQAVAVSVEAVDVDVSSAFPRATACASQGVCVCGVSLGAQGGPPWARLCLSGCVCGWGCLWVCSWGLPLAGDARSRGMLAALSVPWYCPPRAHHLPVSDARHRPLRGPMSRPCLAGLDWAGLG